MKHEVEMVERAAQSIRPCSTPECDGQIVDGGSCPHCGAVAVTKARFARSCPTPDCGGEISSGHDVCPACESVAHGWQYSVTNNVMWVILNILSLRDLFFIGRNFLGLIYANIHGKYQCVDGYQARCKELGVKGEEHVFDGSLSVEDFCKKYQQRDFDRVVILKWLLQKASVTKEGQYSFLDKALDGYTYPRADLLSRAFHFPLRKSAIPVKPKSFINFEKEEADVADVWKRSNLSMFRCAINKAIALHKLHAGESMEKLWNSALDSGFAHWIRNEFKKFAKARKGHREYHLLPQITNLEKIQINTDALKAHFASLAR